MPLTKFQSDIAGIMAANRSPESHLAGGAALHITPNGRRFSHDLDYFHDALERVGAAFEADQSALRQRAYDVVIQIAQPGFVRAVVSKGSEECKVDWAHDSAWRFMPPLISPQAGYVLHPVDLAVNKVLALAGRDEARDFIDILFVHEQILPLGALCWAAAGKDPGFSPLSLLELLKRRGKYRPEDFGRLELAGKIDLPAIKSVWLEALAAAENFIRSRPPAESGCLYYSADQQRFVAPPAGRDDAMPHFGRPGGVLPAVFSGDTLAEIWAASGSPQSAHP